MNSGENDRGVDRDLAELAEMLRTRQAELRALSNSARDSRKPVELDQSKVGRLSRMDALQDQAMAQEAERRRTSELQRIEAALERLKSGDYGYCASPPEAGPGGGDLHQLRQPKPAIVRGGGGIRWDICVSSSRTGDS